MKKNILLILIIFALLLVIAAIVINSLGILDPAPVETAAPTPSVTSDIPAAEVPEPTQSFASLDDGALKTIRDDAAAAMLSCRDAYLAADKGEAQNVVLSDDAVASMVSALGAAGYAAVDYYGNLSMQNPDALAAFGEAISAGLDAQAGYFVVHPDGLVHEELLIYQGGAASVVTVSMQWDGDTQPEVYSSGQYGLESIRYTSNGWLIFSRSGSTGSAGKYSMVRVKPYDADKRALCSRYLSPVGYSENNLFTTDWSTGSWGELDFNSLFAKFYSMYYGTDPLTFNTAGTVAGFAPIDGSSLHLVPAEQFERVMAGYLEIGSDTLRARSDYSSARGGYYFLGTQKDYYSLTPHWPEPELTDYWTNSDGTITMRVNAVYEWGGSDCLFTHEVTVKETDTGFVYVSNRVLGGGDGEPPANILVGERKSQISLLG